LAARMRRGRLHPQAVPARGPHPARARAGIARGGEVIWRDRAGRAAGESRVKYRRFGKTEYQMPVISCGGMRYQQSWKSDDPVGDESQRNLEACILRAFELGINHIET